jgi:transcription initiation factor IIE alpha subunit
MPEKLRTCVKCGAPLAAYEVQRLLQALEEQASRSALS